MPSADGAYPRLLGGMCDLRGILSGSYKRGIIPPQSLHYGAADNTTDKAGMPLHASLQVIITFG